MLGLFGGALVSAKKRLLCLLPKLPQIVQVPHESCMYCNCPSHATLWIAVGSAPLKL